MNKKSILSIVDKNTILEGYNKIDAFCRVYNCQIGLGSYLSSGCRFRNTKIGRFCSIGEEVKLLTGTHPIDEYVSTHPAFYSNNTLFGDLLNESKKNEFNEYKYTDNGYSLEIGHDVWIGSRVTILDGIKIGNGSIIAAGSVVTKDVSPYSIVGGVPATIIRYRFSENQREKIKKSNWFDKDISYLSNINMKTDVFCEEKKNS